jgi:hypothetical protein
MQPKKSNAVQSQSVDKSFTLFLPKKLSADFLERIERIFPAQLLAHNRVVFPAKGALPK